MQQLRLIVMRHAKAGELPGGPDHERALRKRGWHDATAAGRWLRDSGFVPEAAICSSARRTRQTWQQVAAELGGEVPCSTDQRLYQADVSDLLEIIAETPGQPASLMYVGHNPAAAQLAADLTGTELHFPTSAIAVVGLPGSWDQIAPRTGDLLASWTPREGG
ncbi:MAG TPA: histidine phosphatase family protein [Streptosporangiaceae bacterium]|nr:histidine phosphatase family protein [Streptosporangiaceae bacterium]